MLVSLKELLEEARQEQRAVGAFNCYNYETLKGTIEASRELQRPVIIAFGENYFSNMDLSEVVALITEMSKKGNIKVALHLDHSKSPSRIKEAIDAGFTSVMYDGSHLSLEDNIEETKKIVSLAHGAKVSVEAELGSLALGDFSNEEGAEEIYTDPQEAIKFVNETGVDALAVSIGTVHGMYRGEPKINLDILTEINRLVNLPLVLHGGSNTPPEILKEAIKRGITKINVNTDISAYVMSEIKKGLMDEENLHFSTLSLRSREAVKEVVSKYIKLFSNS